VLSAAQEILRAQPALAVDYVAVVDPRTFTAVRPGHGGPVLLVAAARVGGTRLIDNVPVVLPALPTGGRLSDAAAEGRARDAADD